MRHHPGWLAAAVLLGFAGAANAQGVILPGSGPAGRAMGGASTAVALDATSALYWNPAAISALPRSQVVLGGELAYADLNLSSNLPGLGRAGRTRSDSGLGLLLGNGLVYHLEDSPLTVGLGVSSVGGAVVNYPGDPGNPILAPTGPLGNLVLGPIGSVGAFYMITPTASYLASDRIAVGVGPTIDVAQVGFDPAYFGGAGDANGDGLRTFPNGYHSRPFWGGGFRAGVLFRATDALSVGFSYLSPQWFETWKFNTRDEVGNPQELRLTATLPAIYSLGFGYTGIDRLTLAADLRYVDYENTDLFGQRLIDGGLAWRGVFGLGVGGQYRLTDRLALRAGYQYNDNPIPEVLTLFNTQLPGITQHSVSAGFELELNEWVSSSFAYVHAFENSITGPVAQVGNATVTSSLEADYFVFGLIVKFGARPRPELPPCDCYALALPGETAGGPAEAGAGFGPPAPPADLPDYGAPARTETLPE